MNKFCLIESVDYSRRLVIVRFFEQIVAIGILVVVVSVFLVFILLRIVWIFILDVVVDKFLLALAVDVDGPQLFSGPSDHDGFYFPVDRSLWRGTPCVRSFACAQVVRLGEPAFVSSGFPVNPELHR
mgnify:CR=1 FL=1